MLVTIEASIVGFFIALVLGLIFAVLKGVPLKIVSYPARVITEFFRDTPLLVQLFFLYYVLADYGIILPAFLTGALALGVQYSAYTAEVYRAGIEAVPSGQREAARALDFSPTRTFTHVILPQAVPRIVPALGNYLVSIMKDVPVLSVVTVLEMLNVAKIIGDQTFDYLVPLSMVGGLYLILTLVASAIVRCVDAQPAEDRIAAPMSEPIITFDKVVKRFGSHVVLDELDFTVAPGEKVTIIGPSGSGKSTVLRILMTLEKINGGVIRVGGEPLWHERKNGELVPAGEAHLRKMRKMLGMVFQQFNLFPHMTVLRNITEAPVARARDVQAGGARAGRGAARDWSASPTRRNKFPQPAVGRPAAARRHRARARHAARRSCCSTSRPRRSTPSWSARC